MPLLCIMLIANVLLVLELFCPVADAAGGIDMSIMYLGHKSRKAAGMATNLLAGLCLCPETPTGIKEQHTAILHQRLDNCLSCLLLSTEDLVQASSAAGSTLHM